MTDAPVSQFAAKAKNAYRVLATSYIGLLLTLLISTLENPPQDAEPGPMLWLTGLGIAVFKCLPLLLFIPNISSVALLFQHLAYFRAIKANLLCNGHQHITITDVFSFAEIRIEKRHFQFGLLAAVSGPVQ